MLEIVFSASACGGLKVAQHYGQGDYLGGCIGVVVSNHDGSAPTKRQLGEAQRQAEEQQRREWETAVPMGGNSQDVFGFGLMLDIGDISDGDFFGKRKKVLTELFSIYPRDSVSEMQWDWADALETVLRRAATGEPVRVWYSDSPDEASGFLWLMAQLAPLRERLGELYAVKLPEWECTAPDSMVQMTSWGEVPPGEWHRYQALQQLLPSFFPQHCAGLWHALQEENAALRAVVNRQLVSVPGGFYDPFILREIEREDDEFQEAMVVGRVIGKYRLGISDLLIAHRIEAMIRDGKLEVVGAHAEDMPLYHRRLNRAARYMQ